jgi:hypothetical protein
MTQFGNTTQILSTINSILKMALRHNKSNSIMKTSANSSCIERPLLTILKKQAKEEAEKIKVVAAEKRIENRKAYQKM